MIINIMSQIENTNVSSFIDVEMPNEIKDKWNTENISITMRTPGNDEDRVNRLIRRLPHDIATRVQRTGFVNDEERDRRVADAAILVHPSHYEGFGFPIVEAMASGTPVVTTNGGAIPEIAQDAALMVDPGDVDALAGALMKVLEDEGTRERLVRAGQERAAMFSWADTAKGMVDLYRSFL